MSAEQVSKPTERDKKKKHVHIYCLVLKSATSLIFGVIWNLINLKSVFKSKIPQITNNFIHILMCIRRV